MQTDGLTEKKTKSQELFKGRVVDLFLDHVQLPDGTTATREVVRHPGAVAVIAVTPQGKLLLVRQYRYPIDKIIYEIPAGKLEAGEDPLLAAQRELEEETGYKCRELRRIISFYTTPGFSDEYIHLYYTDSLIAGTQHLDRDEFLEASAFELKEAVQLVETKQIADLKSLYAVQYMQLRTSH
ncbi:MAG: NUDIX hydrolase [Sporolactobacillus sp.]